MPCITRPTACGGLQSAQRCSDTRVGQPKRKFEGAGRPHADGESRHLFHVVWWTGDHFTGRNAPLVYPSMLKSVVVVVVVEGYMRCSVRECLFCPCEYFSFRAVQLTPHLSRFGCPALVDAPQASALDVVFRHPACFVSTEIVAFFWCQETLSAVVDKDQGQLQVQELRQPPNHRALQADTKVLPLGPEAR